ncbi:MAG: hypothetical protein LBD06_02560 [Candidatus Accumulibacter sp.]|nr:hypothetical protein [Accumulibacter sp.]
MRRQKTEKPSARFFVSYPARNTTGQRTEIWEDRKQGNRALGFSSLIRREAPRVRGQRFEKTDDRETERAVFCLLPGAKHHGPEDRDLRRQKTGKSSARFFVPYPAEAPQVDLSSVLSNPCPLNLSTWVSVLCLLAPPVTCCRP